MNRNPATIVMELDPVLLTAEGVDHLYEELATSVESFIQDHTPADLYREGGQCALLLGGARGRHLNDHFPQRYDEWCRLLDKLPARAEALSE